MLYRFGFVPEKIDAAARPHADQPFSDPSRERPRQDEEVLTLFVGLGHRFDLPNLFVGLAADTGRVALVKFILPPCVSHSLSR
ncbi:MAG TPA: hypothetical protein VLM40_22105 [Gemmata sp.]|nr:hypothetical protein [Gemmata sp.]